MHHKHLVDCTIWPFGQEGRNRSRNRRDDFWRAFDGAARVRRRIVGHLRYIFAAEADPSALTPGQVENIPRKIAMILTELGGVPAYRCKLAAIWPRLSLFSAAADDWVADYNAEGMRDRVLAAKAAVDKIFENRAPKTTKAWQRWDASATFERARQLAVRMLNRDFAGMTSAERRFALSAFAEFRRPK